MADGSLTGQHIGNYVVIRPLGEGGMGAVYLARHPEIEREVAIKVLGAILLPEQVDRFIDEARAASRIRHPNIIDVYDLGRTGEGRIYYVMEALQGRELKEEMEEHFRRTGRMRPAEVLPILAQVCHGLQAAHDHGVVHRDLKPENIFLLRRKHLAVKILDFGLAKLLEQEQPGTSRTRTGAIMGSPLVIAPEQAAGRHRDISPRTDLYSLGVILYWMLAGRPPFEDQEVWLLISHHIEDLPPPLEQHAPDLPRPLLDLVMQCLEKDPQRRPSSAREVLSRFARAVGREPPSDVEDSLDHAWSARTLPAVPDRAPPRPPQEPSCQEMVLESGPIQDDTLTPAEAARADAEAASSQPWPAVPLRPEAPPEPVSASLLPLASSSSAAPGPAVQPSWAALAPPRENRRPSWLVPVVMAGLLLLGSGGLALFVAGKGAEVVRPPRPEGRTLSTEPPRAGPRPGPGPSAHPGAASTGPRPDAAVLATHPPPPDARNSSRSRDVAASSAAPPRPPVHGRSKARRPVSPAGKRRPSTVAASRPGAAGRKPGAPSTSATVPAVPDAAKAKPAPPAPEEDKLKEPKL